MCQLNCEACYKHNRSRIGTVCGTPTSGVTHVLDAMHYIEQANNSGFGEVALLGGEPTLHPHVFDIVRGIREQGMTPILATNGIIFGEAKNAQELCGTRSVVVTHAYLPSANGRTVPEHNVIDRYSGKPGYAEMLGKALEHLKTVDGTTIVLEMPLVRSLYPIAFDFFRYCRQEGFVPFIEISRRNDTGSPTTDVTPEEIRNLFERCQEFDEQHFPDLAAEHIHPPAYGNSCTMPITGVHVKNLGKGDYGGVYSCCAQKVRHGDLREQSLEEILKSPTLAVYRDQDAYIVGPCRECDLYDTCKGGCRGEAMLRFGCPRASSPACYRIPADVRDDPHEMVPSSCEGCPLEHSEGCALPTSDS